MLQSFKLSLSYAFNKNAARKVAAFFELSDCPMVLPAVVMPLMMPMAVPMMMVAAMVSVVGAGRIVNWPCAWPAIHAHCRAAMPRCRCAYAYHHTWPTSWASFGRCFNYRAGNKDQGQQHTHHNFRIHRFFVLVTVFKTSSRRKGLIILPTCIIYGEK